MITFDEASITLRIDNIHKHISSNAVLNTRECGECGLCCNLLSVPALEKPAREWCKHCSKTGCAIYENRPTVCRTWYCGYRANTFKFPDGSTSTLGEHWRPNKCGMIVSPPHSGRMGIIVAKGSEGKWMTEPWMTDVGILWGLCRERGLWLKINEPRGQYLFDPRGGAPSNPLGFDKALFVAKHEQAIQLGALPLLKAHKRLKLDALPQMYSDALAKAGLPSSSQDEHEGLKIIQVVVGLLAGLGLAVDGDTQTIKRVVR